MSRVDYGTVTIELGEAEYVLKPTLTAIKKIDSQFGSIRQAIQDVSNLSFAAISFIVSTGANLSKTGREKMEEDLFGSGIVAAAGPVAEYLACLMDPSGLDRDISQEGEEEGSTSGKA